MENESDYNNVTLQQLMDEYNEKAKEKVKANDALDLVKMYSSANLNKVKENGYDDFFPSLGRKDEVNHPKHYTSHPSGIECIQVTEHFSFSIGNAIKYLWRADEKGSPIQDLEKALWYIQREIKKRKSK